MNNKIALLFFILLLQGSFFAQTDSSIHGRWTIKASAALTQSGRFVLNNSYGYEPIYTPSYRLEATYGFKKNMEIGFYIGSNKHEEFLTTFYKEYTKQIGLSYNYHILPLLFKNKSLPIDVYLTARVGGIILTKHKESDYYGFNSEYGAGIGVNYFFLKKFGIYADYLFGNFNYRKPYSFDPELFKDFNKIRVGFVVKF